MNFLDLSKRLRQECAGISGVGPSSVLSQTGDIKRVVDWIASAYQDIQNIRVDWNFLRQEFSFTTTAAQQGYTPTQADAADIGEWRVDSVRQYLTSAGVGGEIDLEYVPWSRFREIYQRGTLRTQQGQPVVYTVKPDKSLAFWPIPDASYTVSGEYWQAPDVMALDADVPLIPERYQMVIVWRALVFYAGHAAAPEMFQVGEREYKRLLASLTLSETERPSL